MNLSIETREVLEAAYPLGTRERRFLSHAVVLRDGRVVEPLCRRVKTESLADRGASDPSAAPTCEHCQRLLAKYYSEVPTS